MQHNMWSLFPNLNYRCSKFTFLSFHREDKMVSSTASPIDDFVSDAGKIDLPAWNTANKELAEN